MGPRRWVRKDYSRNRARGDKWPRRTVRVCLATVKESQAFSVEMNLIGIWVGSEKRFLKDCGGALRGTAPPPDLTQELPRLGTRLCCP